MEFPTIDKFAKDVAEKALDEFIYEGKTIREWVEIIAKQQPKVGRWIDVEVLDGALWHACSECGETEFYATNYCPNCGAKMEVEK